MPSAVEDRPVRLGLLGTGLIGARHARMIASEPACRLAGVADPAPAAVAVAAEVGAPYYSSHEELLEREALDGAVVATPTHLHVPLALECLSRKIPVLVEKPIAETVSAGREVVAAAEAAGVCAAVGHHRRFAPAVVETRSILGSGEIGRLIAVSGIWSLRKPDSYYSEAPWRASAGGGPLLINLIHDLDLLRYCCGEIESVYAETSKSERGFAVEESGVLTLRFASGALGSVAFADAAPSPWNWESSAGDTPFVPPTRENCYRFMGATGSLEFPRLAIWRHDAGCEPSWTEPIRKTSRETPVGDALRGQLYNFVSAIHGQTSPACTAADALATLAVVEAAHESARVGKAVKVSTDGMP